MISEGSYENEDWSKNAKKQLLNDNVIHEFMHMSPNLHLLFNNSDYQFVYNNCYN